MSTAIRRLVPVFLLLVAIPVAAHGAASVLGVAELEGDSLCLVSSSPALVTGAQITLVDPRPPQRAVAAEVRELIPDGCRFADGAGLPGQAFRLSAAGVADASPLIAVGVRSASVRFEEGSAEAELDDAPPQETFRLCNASEGMYLTVWSGPPVTGRLRWQRYYYLGYDVEADCTAQDSGDPVD